VNAMNGSLEPFKKFLKVNMKIIHYFIMLNWWCNLMFWYHWLGGDNVLGNELIKSILIRVQVKTSKICIYERIKEIEEKQ
jgi:hypothetical protein